MIVQNNITWFRKANIALKENPEIEIDLVEDFRFAIDVCYGFKLKYLAKNLLLTHSIEDTLDYCIKSGYNKFVNYIVANHKESLKKYMKSYQSLIGDWTHEGMLKFGSITNHRLVRAILESPDCDQKMAYQVYWDAIQTLNQKTIKVCVELAKFDLMIFCWRETNGLRQLDRAKIMACVRAGAEPNFTSLLDIGLMSADLIGIAFLIVMGMDPEKAINIDYDTVCDHMEIYEKIFGNFTPVSEDMKELTQIAETLKKINKK